MSFPARCRLSGMTIEREIHRTFRGPVYLPGDHAYTTARATWNGALDQRPELIAEALGARDVQAALVAARTHGLPFAVQATGHGTREACDGGLLLKTSLMAEVLVDPDRRIARVGPGAKVGDVVAAAAPFGLSPIAGSHATVGIAGFTLGGGYGPLSRSPASPPTTCCAPTSSPPRASGTATPTETPTCSGRCAAAAATSAS